MCYVRRSPRGRGQIISGYSNKTSTALKKRYRTGDKYEELRRQTFELHNMEREKSLIWGIQTSNINSVNGQNEGTTMGLIQCIKTYASGNVSDYTLDAAYNGKTWIEGGEDWLDQKLKGVFKWGGQTKFAFVGIGTLLGLKALAKAGCDIEIGPAEVKLISVSHPRLVQRV